MRRDGRGAQELRPVRVQLDFTANPLASVLFEMGRTKVLCTVHEERSVPRFLQGSGRGWITAEYSLLPGSTERRSDREIAQAATFVASRTAPAPLRPLVAMAATKADTPGQKATRGLRLLTMLRRSRGSS